MTAGVIWGVPLALYTLFVLADGLLFVIGAYQALTGRPAFLVVRFTRERRRRVPATAADCALQGAAQVLQSVGGFLVIGPTIIPVVSTSLTLTGGAPPPPFASISPLLIGAGVGLVLASFAMAAICVGVSVALNLRVKYINVTDRVVAPAQ